MVLYIYYFPIYFMVYSPGEFDTSPLKKNARFTFDILSKKIHLIFFFL